MSEYTSLDDWPAFLLGSAALAVVDCPVFGCCLCHHRGGNLGKA